jgi:DinB superfamily
MNPLQTFIDAPNFLELVVAEAEKNNEMARQLFEGLTEAQLNWKPDANQWSVAQCLEHLAVATQEFDKYFAATLDRARRKPPTANPPAYRPTMMGGWLAKQVAPEAARKLPAPKIFRPADASNIRDALQQFLDRHVKFSDFVRQCDGIDYNRARLRSPVTPLIRYSLADAFVITVLHGQRHLAQANRVKTAVNFPN